eukprot:PITA_29823
MQDWDLLDIPPENGKYTWSNKRIGPGHIAARLDRCLVQSSFLLLGLESRLHILPCSVSDHKPILLEMLGHKDLGPIPFRFNPLWVKEPEFLNLVQDCWNLPVKGSSFYIWEEKLRRLKVVLKTWAKSLPSPTKERKQAQDILAQHHAQREDAEITKEVLDKEAELQQIFHKACLSEEEHWRQKSRSLWLKAGDRNTAFFHKQAQVRKSFNSIAEIKDGNSTHKDFDSIKRAAFNHFQNLYREEGVTDPNSKSLEAVSPKISYSMNQQLEAKISIQEIKDALSDMEPDKAPGPDGFTARFLQTCWQTVEKDLYKMILKSQTCQKIGGSTNSAFLALIPKEKGAKEFNRFRPISLCNIGYELITKVIANRLKGILPAIILKNLGGFVQGRQLADNFILVQKAIHSSQLRKEKEWIHACITDPWIVSLVNGRAASFFKASRGLRQGFPLSPLLFVLHVSLLSFFVDQKLVDQEILGLNIARGVKNVNHTLFVNNTLLLGAASARSASKFKEVLDDYSEATGSNLNIGKCKVFCWNISASTLSAIPRIMGFSASLNWSSFTYLGLPIFRKLAYSRDWAPLLDKFKAKIQAWGFSWLNLAGKTVLIKSVLSSLPIFQFSVILAPSGIIKKWKPSFEFLLERGQTQ